MCDADVNTLTAFVDADDQGWDDIGLHNPRYVNTPNLDRWAAQQQASTAAMQQRQDA